MDKDLLTMDEPAGQSGGFFDALSTGTPSYMIAADTHAVANDQGSLLDPATWAEKAGNAGKFAFAATARAITSTWNIVPTVGNWFGGDFEKLDTGEILRDFDDDLGKYYAENQRGIDIVGDIVSSFVPGLAGVKVLNWGQKGIALAAEGKAGWNLARGFGTLPDASQKFARLAAAEISQSSQTFSFINGNVLKSLAAGYGQAALETAAFETAAAVTMRSSPLFENHDVSDIAYNAILGGGIIGAGIMGSITAAGTFATVKREIGKIDRLLKPVTMTTELPAGAVPSERILAWVDDLAFNPVKPDEVDATKWARMMDQRQTRLQNSIRTEVHAMSGSDKELANTFTDAIQGIQGNQAYANLAGLEKISRVRDKIPDYEVSLTKKEIKEITDDVKSRVAADDPGLEAAIQKAVGDALEAKKPDVKFLRLYGEDAGTVYRELPKGGFSYADGFATREEVETAIRKLGIQQGDRWNPLVVDPLQAEARYIAAQKVAIDPNKPIWHQDLPLIERAFELNTPSITLRMGDGDMLLQLNRAELLDYIKETKLDLANKILDARSIENTVTTTADIAKTLNVRTSYLEGTQDMLYPHKDLFALQSAADDFTAMQVKNGLWPEGQGRIPVYLQPQHIRLQYNKDMMKGIDGHVLDGMSYIQGRRKVYEQGNEVIFTNFAGEDAALFGRIDDKDLLTATRQGAGSGLFTSSNSNYGSLGSKVEQIGRSTATLENKAGNAVAEKFTQHGFNIKNSEAASLELATLRQQVLSTPEKYALDLDGNLVNSKVLKWEQERDAAAQAGAEFKKPYPVLEDSSAPVRIPVQNAETRDFLQEWIAHNDEKLTHKYALRNQQGMQVQDNRGTLYFPSVDARSFPFHALVVDPSVTSTRHTSMIWARNQKELEELVAKVPNDFKVVFKKDTEEYYKALGQYDYNLSLNQNYMDSALKRSGVAAPFFPKTDGAKLFDELLDWRTAQDKYLVKDMVQNRYSAQFRELERLDQEFTRTGTSRVGIVRSKDLEQSASPYTSYIRTALNMKANQKVPLWSDFNNLIEQGVQRLASSVEDLWSSGADKDKLDKINAAFQQAGFNTLDYKAGWELLANHSAPRPILSDFIRKANTVLSTFMLRADPLNAVNNGLGANVLLGSETASLLRNIRTGNAEAAGELSKLMDVALPEVQDLIASPSKLVASSYANFWKKVIGNEDQGKLAAFYKKQGWTTSISDQIRETTEALALRGTEGAAELQSRMQKATALAQKLGDKAERFTGNSFAEEMNRFVAADVARQISDLGVKHGIITEADQLSYINTFINRTQGNFLASQRPLLFKGPVGQAIGLFQTYQFNMLQQVFRHVSEGSKKDAALLLALQGSIYGMNGLPAFNAINQYVVGQAAGNTENRDIIQTTYDVAGKGLGDWLLYGFSSNFLLHPDLKMNLYSRGDINPRQVTVVPTNIADIPIVGATGKLLGAIKGTAEKVAEGANLWPAFLQGIEHAGISRPLAGMAQVLQGYSTTNRGDVVLQNDLMSLPTLTRLVGGKPLDEAIARDALYRVQAYESAKNAEIQKLGQAVKLAVQAGREPTQEQIDEFAYEYGKAGGKQQDFAKFFHRIILGANVSQANAVSQKLQNPYATYMQTVMSGYQLKDFSNSGE